MTIELCGKCQSIIPTVVGYAYCPLKFNPVTGKETECSEESCAMWVYAKNGGDCGLKSGVK